MAASVNSAPAGSRAPGLGPRGRAWLWAALIVAAGLFIYWPALRGAWLWDDDTEITRNPVLGDPLGWWKIWVRPTGPDYFPLKTFLQWCEWHLWRDHVLYYHLVSVAFHLVGALLLWRLLAKLGLRRAYLGGLLFAIHPLCVESVAWISELKNVMSLPLLLLALTAYIDGERRRRDYALALGWFLAALLCKTSGVMLPFVLFLYAWWRRGRIGREDVRASLPFFALALLLGFVTAWFQATRAIAGMTLPLGGPVWRLGSAGLALVFYFFKCLWPVNLLPIYPDWGGHPAWFQPTLCWLLLLLGLSWLWRRRAGVGRPVLFGLGFFLLNLVPVLGFVPMSFLRISRVSDHLCYLPLVGLVGLSVAALNAGLDAWPRLAPRRRAFPVAALAALGLGLAWQSRSYAAVFQNPLSLWSFTVARNPAAWLAQNNLGNALFDAGRTAEATEHYRRAVELNPAYAEAHNNYGNMLLNQGRVADALAQYRTALRILPSYATPQNGIGLALLRTGHAAESIPHFQIAVQTEGDFAEAHYNLGLALAQVARNPDPGLRRKALLAAIAQFQTAIQLKPGYAAALTDQGNALGSLGARSEAIRRYHQAIQASPAYPEAHFNLGVALDQAGDMAGAKAEFEIVTLLRPDFAPAHGNLGLVLQALGRKDEAAAQFRAARELSPARAPGALH
jgi:tetratricopeptide (TPR) repeat protein